MRFNYNAFLEWLDNNTVPVTLTYSQIASIAGTPVPTSYIDEEHRYLQYDVNPFRRKLNENGYKINPDFENERICFYR